MTDKQKAVAQKVVEVSFERHNAFVGPADLDVVLNIIGVGATGSVLAKIAAKMGFTKFKIWDSDVVEPHNLPNQEYDISHVGMAKVDATEQVLKRFNPRIEVEKVNRFFTTKEDAEDLEGPVVIAVDSMSARADIVRAIDGNPLVDLVIESRLGFDHSEVNVIDPMSASAVTNFKNSILDDKEVPEGPCGLRICTTMVNATASYMVHLMCGYYNSIREDTKWTPPKKTVICYDAKGILTHNF